MHRTRHRSWPEVEEQRVRSTGQSTRQLVEAASRSASDAVVEPGEELQARVKTVSVGAAFLVSKGLRGRSDNADKAKWNMHANAAAS